MALGVLEGLSRLGMPDWVLLQGTVFVLVYGVGYLAIARDDARRIGSIFRRR